MKKELQDKLYKKYPKIFEQRKLPITQTCMCWGVETGDGWYKLLEILCASLQWDTDKNGYPQVVATQVKEKFGTLRFYYNWGETKQEVKKKYTDRQYAHQEGKISFAEHLTETICEGCGAMVGVTQTTGWIVTLCHPCLKKYRKEKGITIWKRIGSVLRRLRAKLYTLTQKKEISI